MGIERALHFQISRVTTRSLLHSSCHCHSHSHLKRSLTYSLPNSLSFILSVCLSLSPSLPLSHSHVPSHSLTLDSYSVFPSLTASFLSLIYSFFSLFICFYFIHFSRLDSKSIILFWESTGSASKNYQIFKISNYSRYSSM